ncbi:hypothetical protein A3I45_04885 [Candidatus Uhrbacteria bacterium RIFCSPLOWO2_02_FULL_53_10]|uniref:Uncharacterized protein n=1 Tax=Candidatus Uhrbacteria bacterium RIFCSPLOWO2_02_FULL_53_10 TaxID=1802411 RepID=A0A1F7VH27_9BACT|nr:MAG: hypothetical protein A3I45_04885 [Candidatus Uhrbacteria bacterium RIFCSPLOWO2_02_FULL_53_10]
MSENPRPWRLRRARDIEEGLHEYDETVEEERAHETGERALKEQRLNFAREQARAPMQEGFLSAEALASLVRQRTDLFAVHQLEQVEARPQQAVKAYDGTLYALPITGRDRLTKQEVDDWLVVEFPKDGTAQYCFKQEVIAAVKIPPAFEMSWLQEMSAAVKVVKSRPAWMYPELFQLPPQDVWPRNAKVAVIGDPYQACDRPGVTIIEYEYSEEVLPPMVEALADPSSKLYDAGGWLEDIYFEEVRALDRMYGSFTPPSDANPYRAVVDRCIEAYGNLFHDVSTHPADAARIVDRYQMILRELKQLKDHFVQGEWSVEDAYALLHCDNEEAWVAESARRVRHWNRGLPDEISQEEREQYLEQYSAVRQSVQDWFDFKQSALEQNGKPEAWSDFIKRWEALLSILPNDELTKKIPSFEKDVQQAQHWLEVLPTAKSPQRINNGIKDLERFFDKIRPHLEELYESSMWQSPLVRPVSEDAPDPSHTTVSAYTAIVDVEQISDTDFGAFGYFRPGHAVSLRTNKMLDQAVERLAQLMVYCEGLVPQLRKEITRLKKAGVPLSPSSLKGYLHSFERAWVKQHLFQKRTQNAVPIHGFFPYDMPDIDPQDRILAHTSVTMHGWNHMNESDFRAEFEKSLSYLTVGGRYILGPINQHVYFGGVDEGFDARGLMRALESLKQEGKIDFSFQKGVRPEVMHGWYDGPIEDGPETEDDPTVLYNGEAAHSLVMTRLK